MKRVLDYLRFGAINKILPLTYDDSLSYYEMCCKMLSKINEIVAAYNDNFSDMVKDEIINNLTEENREKLMGIIELVMIDTISSMLGIIDGSSTLSECNAEPKLYLNDIDTDGELQDLFLEYVEEIEE